jgi:2-polyprenyl-3-methyl-5-hydroxy-6-metoxy-1,4-benzoquinol methylase
MGKELLNLGELYVSDFVNGDMSRAQKHELKLVMDDDTGAARLETTMPVNNLFGKYWYLSGTNQSMKRDLKDVVDSILSVSQDKEDKTWLDIACNDGTLLGYVPRAFIRVGIDPAEDRIAEAAMKRSDIHIQDFFSASAYKKAIQLKADVITTIAMFYDLEDPDQFCKDVYEIMDDEGLWVIQMSYTPLMVEQLAFDNILSEHVYYHTYQSMYFLLDRNGFRIMDIQLNNVNGGSMRLFVKKQKADPSNFGSQTHRDVCRMRVKQMWLYEKENPIDWKLFYENIQLLRKQVMDFITTEKKKGKSIMGYGASTKGNTLLQWFGLDSTMIDAIAEKQEAKWGLRTVGSNIPIISEEEMRERNPDYLLILPWHFISEFMEREKDWHHKGGKWIVPCPKFQVI